MLSLGVGLTSVPVLARRGPAYDPDALAFFARLTNQPTDARKKLYSDLFIALKAGTNPYSKLDELELLAAADAQAARTNLVANTSLTAVGAPTFQADRGYTGDGAGAYLSGRDLSTLSKYSINSAFMLVGIRSGATPMAGNAASVNARIRVLAGNRVDRINDSTSFAVASGATGLLSYSRTGASVRKLYLGATEIASDTAAATGVPAGLATPLRDSTSYSASQITAYCLGSGLTGAEVAQVVDAINTYLTAVGA